MLLFLVVLPFCIYGQLFGVTTIPNGCGYFQYPNASLDKNNLPPMINQALYQIDNYLEYIYKSLNLPSISFGIVYEQQLLYYKSYGYSHLETNTIPNENTIYRIGSVSKVFTVLLTYILRDRGIIHLDDYISSFNSNFSINNPWGITNNQKLGKTITIKQLASQLSGLPRQPPCLFGDGIGLNISNILLCNNATTNDIINLLKDEYIQHPLNIHPSYSNTAYAILGNILSEYMNMTYEEAVFEYIFKPLNLTHTGLYLDSSQLKYASSGYNFNENDNKYIPTNWDNWGWVSPAAQIFSSINDLSQILQQIFASYPSIYSSNNNKFNNYFYLMSPELYRDWLLPQYINPDLSTGFGAPWEIQELSGELIRTKGGDVNGFSSHIDIIPDMRLGVIGLINTQIDASIITYPIMEILIPVIKSYLIESRSLYKSILPSHNILNMIIGEYYFVYNNQLLSPPFYIQIIELNGNKWLNAYDPIYNVYGTLIWDQNQINNNTLNFFWHQINDNTKSCWLTTLGGEDAVNIQFIFNQNETTVKYAVIPDYFYGFVFDHQPNGFGIQNKHKLIQNKTIFNGAFINSKRS